jgi:hypothetical protein
VIFLINDDMTSSGLTDPIDLNSNRAIWLLLWASDAEDIFRMFGEACNKGELLPGTTEMINNLL